MNPISRKLTSPIAPSGAPIQAPQDHCGLEAPKNCIPFPKTTILTSENPLIPASPINSFLVFAPYIVHNSPK